jgi:tetratricopeptide (TPR) repeat protein/tRNA A-37 threonylcarbamoyl transferase component Bud32
VDARADETLRGRPRRADPLEVELARERTRDRLIGSEHRPVTLGRYRLLQRLGEGGMGTVYVAFDPALERRVAIKVVRSESLDEDDIRRLETRLVREARALARLAEPNVVQLFEIGRGPSGVFIVMELIDGVTLRRWVADEDPEPGDILRVIVDAARGLAAAHRAGLVHRDIKPDNLLLARDGRLRVADFGLADAMMGRPSASRSHAQSTTLSRSPVGTPMYMAPEQLAGAGVDGRADQYSLAVTLRELLDARRSPKWINRAIDRALARNPDDRYPDMLAFAAALERRRAIASLRRLGPFAFGLAVAAAMAASLAPDAHPCRSSDPWDANARSELERAFAATAVPYAGRAAANVTADLDAWQHAYAETRTTICAGQDVEHDPRWPCLERARDKAQAFIGVLVDADAELVANASDQSRRLEDPARCLDADTPTEPANVRMLGAELERVVALTNLGRLADAAAGIEPIVREASATEHDVIIARALLVRGQVRRRLGELADARMDLEHAYWIASENAAPEIAAIAAAELATAIPRDTSEGESALVWTRHAWAEAMAADASPGLRQRVLFARGVVLDGLGRTADAVEAFREALEVAENAHDCVTDCGSLQSALHNLGFTLLMVGRESEAFEMLERSLALQRERAGPDHPGVATSHQALAIAFLRRSRYEEAREHYTAALEIRERVLGPDHIHLAETLNGLASVEMFMGELDSAEARLSRALDIAKRADSDPAELGMIVATLATLQQERGDPARALELHREAYGLFERSVGEHAWTATSLHNQANAHADLRDHVAAEDGYRRSIAMRERINGPGDPELALALGGLGQLLVDTDREAEAVPLLERAVALVNDPDDPRATGARFQLARALWPSEPERARAIASETLSHLRGDDEEQAALRASVLAWLDQHR